ncbi:hypothetical protein EDB86DRAFT_2885857 [Lactarius hatsudake]|nr:hypothetical protein EDB86DRAFT_2885857 [Lactarius hatsudake]
MSGYQSGSASTHTGSSNSSAVADVNDEILQEIKRAIFTVNLTAHGAPLQADPDDVQNVFDHLRHNYSLTSEALFRDEESTPEAPRLPPSGFKFTAEKESYEPLTHILNIIVHAANTCLTHMRYLKDLHFDVHDVEMPVGNILDSGKPQVLKPVILGLLHPRTLNWPKIVWEDVAVIVEVKGHTLDLVKQLATYARNHLSLNRRRSFSITIAFDHKALTMCFLCFHRSGVSASELLKLNEEDGFRSVIEHMVGILSIRDEAGFGLDMTRVNDMYHLNGRYYAIVRTIQNRDSIRGRATAVYRLKYHRYSRYPGVEIPGADAR